MELLCRIIRERVADEFPVHQVPRVQDRESREIVERRGRHIIVVPYPAHVRVTIVQMEHRVEIPQLGRQRKSGKQE
jgi:hypothetical protein